MKILGVSLGTKNGNNDTMCRVALEAAKNAGAEIEFIHLFDWDIKYCSGCVACSRALVMGKGMVCTQKDDYKAFYEKMVSLLPFFVPKETPKIFILLSFCPQAVKKSLLIFSRYC